ncbi:DUF1835 domain-containing protein [Paenibacillus thalictri]|uniref:DUF1835 domain-containing protein n=1 Tax=Paenibacillus thalictri TaxID=2527873 RepID=A0A4Q9DUF3_9BACL|nr:DUF1835 domain-containing protein [Paenibacillus thalictri]TBL80579.1 DUF1835 domain-containing protein [Paenibacillus thalictri]
MLHIVNGDSVAKKLRQGLVPDDILVWREVYPHGPVFEEPAAVDHRKKRARYLERTLGIPRSEYIMISETQDKTLAGYSQYKEVVLWFEHDLFDQAMLCYLLHWFSKQFLSQTKLSLLSIGEFPGIEPFRGLGQLTPEQLQSLSGTWKSVSPEAMELGSALWQAYSSSEPDKLQKLLSEDTSALPFAQEAFKAHLSRFPSVRNGLGCVEQMTLELVETGINSPGELFGHVSGRLHILGIGDLQYWHILKKLSQGPYPLLSIRGMDGFPAYDAPTASFVHGEIALTAFGRSVLAEEADRAAKQGIDEWYGGVHVQGKQPRWRWDTVRQTLYETAEA